MPNLASHIDLALQAAERLDRPALGAHMGYYLMGSTAPDIRAITRQRRAQLHFTELDFEAVGAGVAGMFQAHPALLESDEQDAPTRAFLTGYMTHLIMDEAYVIHVYRPYFGNRDIVEDAVAGRMLDRALQIYMDKDVWEGAQRALADVEFCPEAVSIEFLELESLTTWGDWVARLVGRGFTWERLRNMTPRIVGDGNPQTAEALVDDFLQGIPESIQRLRDLVPDEVIAGFKTEAVDCMVASIGEYLS